MKHPCTFQSFDALQKFREVLKEQERIIVPKKELSEDETEELNHTVQNLNIGMIINVVYYHNNDCIKINGYVSKLDFDNKFIQIVKRRINFEDILEIEIEK